MITDPVRSEHCDRCGGPWPGFGPKATLCATCDEYFCGHCWRRHQEERHMDYHALPFERARQIAQATLPPIEAAQLAEPRRPPSDRKPSRTPFKIEIKMTAEEWEALGAAADAAHTSRYNLAKRRLLNPASEL